MMKRYLVCIFFITVCYLVADISFAFEGPSGCGKDGCREDCTSCHTLTTDEASNILKVKVTAIKMSPVKGLWEVEGIQNETKFTVYIDFGKQYVVLVRGFIAIEDINKPPKLKNVDPAKIPLEDAIIMGNPQANFKIIVFDDPDCPYCKKFHTEIKKIITLRNDIAFYIKLFPLKDIHPEAYEKSKAIVCKRSLKLLEDAFDGKELPKPDCETDVIDKNIELAENLEISGTPAIILPDGALIPGFVDSQTLLNIFHAIQKIDDEQELLDK